MTITERSVPGPGATKTLTGGQAVVETLARLGVRAAFGIPGVHNLAIYDALVDHPEIQHLVARHEQGAAFMADGYARVTGKTAAVLVTTGPGVLNSLTPLAEAYADSQPVLLISTVGSSHYLGQYKGTLHEMRDQAALLDLTTAGCWRVREMRDIPAAVAAAYQATRAARRRPAAVEIPIDFLDGTAEFTLPAPVPETPALPPDPGLIDQAAERLLGATRPLLYAGGGVISADGSAALTALAEALNAPVLTSTMGKGAIDELHPLALGGTWGPSSVPRRGGLHFEVLQRADAALAVGTRFTGMSTGHWALPFPSRLIHVDVDPEEFGRNYRPELAIQADARAALEALLQAVGGRRPASQWSAAELAEYKRRWRDEARAHSPLGLAFVEALRDAIPPDGVLANDQCMLNYWASRFYPVRAPRTFLYPIGSATLGFGAPAGYGAKAGRPDLPVVVVAGDGGFLFTVQELASAVQARLAIPVVVLNDGAYGMIKAAQRRRFGERFLAVDLENPDFVRLGEAFGAHATRADSPEALQRAVATALAADRPTLIEVQAQLPPPIW